MLTDPAVAVLARQAVDLLDPDIDVRIEPEPGADPYRWGAPAWLVWPLIDGPTASFGIWLPADLSPVEALARLLDGLSNDVSETARFWGQPFPTCPGHEHPASVAAAGDAAVVLRCPASGDVVGRIEPAV